MYQDKIKNEAELALRTSHTEHLSNSIFEHNGLKPLSFCCDALVGDPLSIARDILAKRTDDEIIILSNAINSIMHVGDTLFLQLAVKLLSGGVRKSVSLSQGRTLYLLRDYFALDTIPVKNVQWGEMFATLTLMQAAEVCVIQTQDAEVNNESEVKNALTEALNAQSPHVVEELHQEIIDSIARAECLYDKNQKAKKLASSGGTAKALRIEPLKIEVIKRYFKDFQKSSDRNAGKSILKKFKEEGNPLIALCRAEELHVQFSKWIGDFKNGKLKFSIEI